MSPCNCIFFLSLHSYLCFLTLSPWPARLTKHFSCALKWTPLRGNRSAVKLDMLRRNLFNETLLIIYWLLLIILQKDSCYHNYTAVIVWFCICVIETYCMDHCVNSCCCRHPYKYKRIEFKIQQMMFLKYFGGMVVVRSPTSTA